MFVCSPTRKDYEHCSELVQSMFENELPVSSKRTISKHNGCNVLYCSIRSMCRYIVSSQLVSFKLAFKLLCVFCQFFFPVVCNNGRVKRFYNVSNMLSTVE